jgi:hypothetical protein
LRLEGEIVKTDQALLCAPGDPILEARRLTLEARHAPLCAALDAMTTPERGVICGKALYPDEATAEAAARVLGGQGNDRRAGVPWGAYACLLCGGWHCGHRHRRRTSLFRK